MLKRTSHLTSAIAHSEPDRIIVRGLDLCGDILGQVNLGDMAFLQMKGRLPDAEESRLFNALVVTLVEHGVTPSALAARLTYLGAPEALQGAVAAGLLGLGQVFVGSMETAAMMMQEALPLDHEGEADVDALAAGIVADLRARRAIVPGLGHPLHKPVDPRAPRLFQIAAECGRSGRYVALMQAVEREAQAATGKVLPINATGAIAAIACELGFAGHVVRGFGVMARAIGLVGHIMEEAEDPMAFEIWQRAEEEVASGHRSEAGEAS